MANICLKNITSTKRTKAYFAPFFVFVFIILGLLSGKAVLAATYDVDRLDDVGSLACTGAANDCDYRSAIENASTNPGADTITFSVSGDILLTDALGTVELESNGGVGDYTTIDGSTSPAGININVDDFTAWNQRGLNVWSNFNVINDLTFTSPAGTVGSGLQVNSNNNLIYNLDFTDFADVFIAPASISGSRNIFRDCNFSDITDNALYINEGANNLYFNNTFTNLTDSNVGAIQIGNFSSSATDFYANNTATVSSGATLYQVTGLAAGTHYFLNSSASNLSTGVASTGQSDIKLINSTFSNNSQDIYNGEAGSDNDFELYNTSLGSATEVYSWPGGSNKINSYRHDQTDGEEIIWGSHTIASGETMSLNYTSESYGDFAYDPAYSGTGDGTMTVLSTPAGTESEIYRAELTTVAPDGGTFTVTRTNDGAYSASYDITTGTFVTPTGVQFSIADGAADFSLGDTFLFATVEAAGDANTKKSLTLKQRVTGTNDSLVVENGGTLEADSSTAPAGSGTEIIFDPIDQGGYYINVQTGGTFDMDGSVPNVLETLSASVALDADLLYVTNSSNFAVGDRITVGSGSNAEGFEVITNTSGIPNTIMVKKPNSTDGAQKTHNHASGDENQVYKTATTLSAAASAGDTTIEVGSTAAWSVGDYISISSSSSTAAETESQVLIVGIPDATHLDIDTDPSTGPIEGLVYDHTPSSSLPVFVVKESRNSLITSSNQDGDHNGYIQANGGELDFDYIEATHLGYFIDSDHKEGGIKSQNVSNGNPLNGSSFYNIYNTECDQGSEMYYTSNVYYGLQNEASADHSVLFESDDSIGTVGIVGDIYYLCQSGLYTGGVLVEENTVVDSIISYSHSGGWSYNVGGFLLETNSNLRYGTFFATHTGFYFTGSTGSTVNNVASYNLTYCYNIDSVNTLTVDGMIAGGCEVGAQITNSADSDFSNLSLSENSSRGIQIQNSSSLTINNLDSFDNGGYGMILNNVDDSSFGNVDLYNNDGIGIFMLAGSNTNDFSGLTWHNNPNSNSGLYMVESSYNNFTNFEFADSASTGSPYAVILAGSNYNSFSNGSIHDLNATNAGRGLYVWGSGYNAFQDLEIYNLSSGVGYTGVGLDGGNVSRFSDLHIHDISGVGGVGVASAGFNLEDSSLVTLDNSIIESISNTQPNSTMGLRLVGDSTHNSIFVANSTIQNIDDWGIVLSNSNQPNIAYLFNSTIDQSDEVSLSQNTDIDWVFVSSYRHDQTPGAARIWGRFNNSPFGSESEYSYGSALSNSFAMDSFLRRGAGHSLSAVTTSSSTVAELWTVTYDSGAGNWVVAGSVSGTQANRATSGVAYSSDSGEVAFTVTQGGAPDEGDQFVFNTIAGTSDANVQKNVQVGDGDNNLDFGQSRLNFANPLVLDGGSDSTRTTFSKIENNEYLVDVQNSIAAEYFEFSDLGAFSESYPAGMKLSSGATISTLHDGAFTDGYFDAAFLSFSGTSFDPAYRLTFDGSTAYDVAALNSASFGCNDCTRGVYDDDVEAGSVVTWRNAPWTSGFSLAQSTENPALVNLSYTGYDLNNASAYYAVSQYSIDQGATWHNMTRHDSGDPAFSRTGAPLTFVWDAGTDLGEGSGTEADLSSLVGTTADVRLMLNNYYQNTSVMSGEITLSTTSLSLVKSVGINLASGGVVRGDNDTTFDALLSPLASLSDRANMASAIDLLSNNINLLLLLLALAVIVAFFVYFLRVHRQEKSAKKSLVALADKLKTHCLILLHLYKKPAPAFSEIIAQNQQGTYEASYDDFKKDRKITLYTVSSAVALVLLKMLLVFVVPYFFLSSPLSTLASDYDGDGKEVARGDVLTYRLAYENTGTAHTSSGLKITDVIPANTTYVEGSLALSSMVMSDQDDGDKGLFTADQSQVEFNIGSIAPGESGTATFSVQVNDDASDGAQIKNTALAADDLGSSFSSNTTSNTVKVQGNGNGNSNGNSNGNGNGNGNGNSNGNSNSNTNGNANINTNTNGNVSPNGTTNTNVSVNDNSRVKPSEENDNKKAKEDIVVTPKDKSEKAKGLIGKIKEAYDKISSNPLVKATINYGVAPLAIIAVALNLLSAIPLAMSFINFLYYLLQLLLTPFYYFTRGKRKQWGTIYSSLTKEPVDLAMVRLVNKQTGKIVETQVTGPRGRYSFLVPPGEYQIMIQKPGYAFPSTLKAGATDRPYFNLYHGETIMIEAKPGENKENGETYSYIAHDIPLDQAQGTVLANGQPVKLAGATLTSYLSQSRAQTEAENKTLFKKETWRKFSWVIAVSGPVLGLLSFILEPSYFTGALLVLHALLLLLFVRLVRRKDTPPWGKVYNLTNKQALPKSIIRLFDTQYGRLLLTYITKQDGKYGFLVGDDRYVLTVEKQGYALPEGKVEILPAKEGMVKKDLGMREAKG